MELLKIGLTALSIILTFLGLWHVIVIAPLKERINSVDNKTCRNTKSIQSLEIDHAKLATTLENLAKAIDRLTDKFDRA